ncbi:hypothetical protein [Deinococcus roseus]|uniref:Uncharacterized protein n=1 Tax=Deinococcus roseus TaxID=392414 RepID=A0ABQ2D3F3_9DEIO|nr:hypothetical protein [Deinococcus roseus]GGJ44610.1 hypothetical protein GCM10008938_33480 [Deinococcus roseus]
MQTHTPARQMPPIQFRDVGLEARIQGKTTKDHTKHQVAKTDLSRYYVLIGMALKNIHFSVEQLTELSQVAQKHNWHADQVQTSWAKLQQEASSTLRAVLDTLTPMEVFAVVDALEFYWTGETQGITGFKRVGLLKATD